MTDQDWPKNPFFESHTHTNFELIDVQGYPVKAQPSGTSTDILVTYLTILIQSLRDTIERVNGLTDEISGADQKKIELISLRSDNYKLKCPIPIYIEHCDEQFIATFYDAEVSGYGETDLEAIENLVSNIISLYEELNEDVASLGPLPKKWLSVLTEIIA